MTAMYLDAAEKLLKKDHGGAKDLLKRIVEKDRDKLDGSGVYRGGSGLREGTQGRR